MKFTNSTQRLKLNFLYAVVFSFFAAYGLAGLVSPANAVLESSPVNRRQLFRNYRFLNYFLSAKAIASPDAIAASDRDHPLLADMERLTRARRLLDERSFEACDRMLAAVSGRFPHIAAKRDELRLRSLHGARKFKSFIRCHARRPADSLPIRVMFLDALLRDGRVVPAQAVFRDLFGSTELAAFTGTISRPALRSMLKGLDEDAWFGKFSFLLETGSKAEFRREWPFCRFRSLVRLFQAEFAYLDRAYARAQNLLQGGLDAKWRPFAEKLSLKIAVRLDPGAEIEGRLQALGEDSALYPGLLSDLAQILAGKGEFARALPLYAKYLEQDRARRDGYWKAVWRLAWIHYRLDQREQALKYFAMGAESPVLSYRIASRYWLGKLGDGPTSQLQGYPFSYYAVRSTPDKAHFRDLLQSFVRTIDKPPGRRFLEILADLKMLAKYGLWQDGAETIHAVAGDPGLQASDRNLLKIIESILYMRQDRFDQAFAVFRGNFKAIESVRLPNFLSAIFFPRPYAELITACSREQVVDPCLVQALIREESFFRPDSLSPAKAYGLMQLLHGTAREIARGSDLKIKARDLYDPEINIRLGLNYLKMLLDKYDGRLYLSLAAYNAGTYRVDQWLQDFPGAGEEEFIEMIPFSETRNYVKNILRNYFFYRYYHDQGLT